MEMESMAGFTAGLSCDRARQIIRGKRTKRQRTCSPFGAAVTTSSSSCGGGGGNSTADGGSTVNYYPSDQSPTISSDMSTDEEEDMANCLIMLAQSVSPVMEEKSDHRRQKMEKLNSGRLTEMATTTAGGKSGLYTYECKTCNRSFPSFQALGGHRASHKKLKLNVEEKKYVSVHMEFPEEDQLKLLLKDEEHKIITSNKNNNRTKCPPSPPAGLIQTASNINNSKGKIHECSICGSEFLSGQALGGHMRRHRTTPAPSSNQMAISMNINDRSTDAVEKSMRRSSMLSLDLNLPAPEMVDDVHSKLQFTASSSQQHLVFSAPTLVDCHY